MELNQQAVDAYKTLMCEPEKHGLPFKPLAEYIKESEEATALHILFDNYLTACNLRRDKLPKVFFYIIMEDLYGKALARDKDGNAGYNLKISA